MERFRKVILDVVGQLPDAVQGRVANLGARMLEVLDDCGHYRLNLLHPTLYVLAYLREG